MDAVIQLNSALAGRYVVDREIGAGGMATVYLARDLRHDRKVALKVLNPELGAVLGVERFLSEIKVTANLQHPNLLPLFDSGEAEGLLFYVMPYVEGESLRSRIEREKQLPIDEALRLATAVAGALDYAHRHGVIHRDLKPENILLHEGQPLVADFGIALAVSKAGGQRVTQTGLSLGTPQYMSPEQATGDRVIDGRTDIYSLAAMLYEMLAGEPPHSGTTAQAIIAKVLTDTPRRIRLSRDTVPVHVEQAINRALAKLPADRFSTAHDFADALSGRVAAAPPLADADAGSPRGDRLLRRQHVAYLAAIVAVIAVGALGWLRGRGPEQRPVFRFALAHPITHTIYDNLSFGPTLAISPRGDRIAYLAASTTNAQVWVRPTNEMTTRLVASAVTSIRTPCFSPDGQWIAFADGNVVKKVSVDGGPLVTLATLPQAPTGLSWSATNSGIVASSGRGMLFVINENGAGRLDSIALPRDRGAAAWPVFAPDGRTVVVGSVSPAGRMAVTSLDDRAVTTIDGPEGLGTTPVGFLDDYLVYVTPAGALMAVPFDVGQRKTTGSAVVLAEQVMRDNIGGVKAALSATGTLVYRSGRSQTVPVIARGATTPLMTDSSYELSTPRFSPDGRRVAFTVTGPTTDVWVYDRRLTTFTKVTSDGINRNPEWSPDGKRILFISSRGPQPAIWWQLADASAPAELLFTPPEGDPYEAVFSPDGKWLVYRTGPAGNPPQSILAVPLDGDGERKPTMLATGNFRTADPRVSPDGRWLAYYSSESGTNEVVVRSFPMAGGRQQVSSGGGTEPIWGKSGNAFYYRTAQNVMSVPVTTRTTFGITGPRSVRLSGDYMTNPSHPNWDVSPDGSEILMIRRAGEEVHTIVVENWGRELRERMAGKTSR